MATQSQEIKNMKLISRVDLNGHTTNPFQPREVAYFVPRIPDGAEANGINDVHVDENGIVYVVDRLQGGLYILELNI